VDRDSDIPPSKQIADELRNKIRSGEFPPRSRLPSITDLVQTHGVARVTALKVLRTLVDEGYARTERGWGTYVTAADQWPTDGGVSADTR
jgi:GntR family transcriptional regulator